MLIIACCLAVGLALDFVSGLVVATHTHTHLYQLSVVIVTPLPAI